MDKHENNSGSPDYYSEYVDFIGRNKEFHTPFDMSAFRYISGPVSMAVGHPKRAEIDRISCPFFGPRISRRDGRHIFIWGNSTRSKNRATAETRFGRPTMAVMKYRGAIWIMFGDNHGFGTELLHNSRENISIEVLIYSLRECGFRIFLESLAIPDDHIGMAAVLCDKLYTYIDARDQKHIRHYTDKMDDMVEQLDAFNKTKNINLLNSIKASSWKPESLTKMISLGIPRTGIRQKFSHHKTLIHWVDKENSRRRISYTQLYKEMMESKEDDPQYPFKVDDYVAHLFQWWGIIMEAYTIFNLLEDESLGDTVVFSGKDHIDVVKRFALEELKCDLLFSTANNVEHPKRFVDLGHFRMSNAFK